MLRRTIFAVSISLITLAVGANAFALDPYICEDGESDCDCAATYDVCYEVGADDLTSPDDPAALREATNLTATWNSNLEAYEVELDVTDLTAGGVMKLNSNNGQWDDLQELNNYMEELLGLDGWAEACRMEWPRMYVRQTGNVYRYDQHNDDWAELHGGLIVGAVTNGQGQLNIAGNTIDLFDNSVSCPDSSSDATDYQEAQDLRGEQCSWKQSKTMELCGEELGPICSPICKTYTFESTRTRLQTADTESLGTEIKCKEDDLSNGIQCTESSGVIIHSRVEADYLQVQNTYFAGTTGNGNEVEPLSESHEFDVQQWKSGSSGVCGDGEAEETVGSTTLTVELDTRVSPYNTQIPACTL